MVGSCEPTILITGGAGFIGANLVHLAVSTGFKVVNLDALTYAGNKANLETLNGNPRHVFVHGSITDRKLVESILTKERPSAILNLAAESHVDRSIDGPAIFMETNVMGTLTLLDLAKTYYANLPSNERSRFRLIHVSTDEVFGSVEEGASTEDSRYEPNSPYAASKAGADHLVRAFGKTYGLPVIITNCSNNYGPYQFPEKLIPVMILSALEGVSLPVYGDGRQIREWLHVLDHSRALLLVLEKGEPGDKYNIGSEARIENIELVRTICTLLQEVKPSSLGRRYVELIEMVSDRPGHDRRYALDSSRIRERLGWKPEINLTEGLKQTIRWYLSHVEWWTTIRTERYGGERLGTFHA